MIGWAISKTLGSAVSFLYPAYASFKALETPAEDDDKQWLTYWIVVAFFTIAEEWADVLVSWVPLYWEAKLVFIIWLQAPQTLGAHMIYEQYLRPYLLKNQKDIDGRLAAAKDELKTKAKDLSDTVKDKAPEIMAKLADLASPKAGGKPKKEE